MNQPPDDDFYNDSTANTGFPPQQRPGQPPVPQWPQQPAPNNYPRQVSPGGQPGPAWQPGPMNQPQFTPPPQGPASQPGFGPPNFGRPGQPGWENAPQNAGMPPERQPGYPPPSGPISRPGFSNTSRPLDASPFAATDPAPLRPGNNPPNGNPAAPWGQPPQQQPGPNFGPGPGPAPWNQPPQTPPPGPAPWSQPQNDALPNWNNQPPQPATPPKKPRLGLIITLVIIVLVVVIGGTSGLLYLRSSRGGTASTGTPTAQGTASTSGVTPVATTPTGTAPTTGGLHTIGTPVQAGNDWVVTVTSVKETGSSLIPPGANNTYLEINLTLKNTSGSTLTLVSYLFFTLDSSKHETAGDTNIHRTPDGSVSANQTLDAQIAFEVPKSQHTFTFTFAYGLSHNTNASVAWQLTV